MCVHQLALALIIQPCVVVMENLKTMSFVLSGTTPDHATRTNLIALSSCFEECPSAFAGISNGTSSAVQRVYFRRDFAYIPVCNRAVQAVPPSVNYVK